MKFKYSFVLSAAFNAAPTLLERQQESISERLKNYKSVTELLTTKDGAPITTILQNNPIGESGAFALIYSWTCFIVMNMFLGTSIIESLRTSIRMGDSAALEDDGDDEN